jgi:hypothetical protein
VQGPELCRACTGDGLESGPQAGSVDVPAGGVAAEHPVAVRVGRGEVVAGRDSEWRMGSSKGEGSAISVFPRLLVATSSVTVTADAHTQARTVCRSAGSTARSFQAGRRERSHGIGISGNRTNARARITLRGTAATRSDQKSPPQSDQLHSHFGPRHVLSQELCPVECIGSCVCVTRLRLHLSSSSSQAMTRCR